MKYILKHFLTVFLVASVVAGCEKKEVLPFYEAGSATVLSSSVNSVAAAPADSLKPVLSFSWTNPKYSTDELTYKYVIQIDTLGGNFSKAYSRTITGIKEPDLSTSFTAMDLNNLLIGFGSPFGKETTLIARLLASYGNNNEQKASNTVNVKVTPFTYAFTLSASDAGPFSIDLGNKDDILQTFNWVKPNVGNGTYTYKLQYDKAGNNFAAAKSVDMNTATVFEVSGANLNKYAQDAGIPNDQAGELEFRVMAVINGNQSLFSTVKKFTVTPTELIAYLYVPGDYQGWDPGAAPRLASTNLDNFEGYVNMTSANGFKINNAPDWNHTNYGDGGPGKLSTSGGNLSLPVGYYLVKTKMTDLTWSSTLITTWGVIGDATPGGWDNSTALTYDPVAKVWKGTIDFKGTGGWKFRANNGWDINLGGSPTYLKYNGDNISAPSAGLHVVTLDLRNPLKYTYTVQ